MEKERILGYQKKFSNLHLILVPLVAVIMIEHGVYGYVNNLKVSILLCIAIAVIEYILRNKQFFSNTHFAIVYRYLQVLGISLVMITDLNRQIATLVFVLFFLVCIEFMINFDVSDKYYRYFSLALVAAPAFLLQILKAISYSGDKAIISSLVCVLIACFVLNTLVEFYVDVTDRLEKKYLAQLRYIEDANAMNQQLVENQEKVKKANEQLATQKIQLEFAYSKINHVNAEILLQNQILKLISAHHDIERLMALIVATIRSQMNVDTFAILLYPNAVLSENMIYKVRSTYGVIYQQFLGEKIEAGTLFPYISKRETYVDNHVNATKYEFVRNTEVASLMIIPLIKAEDVIGGLYIADSKYDAFIDNVPFFEATVSSINLAVENSNLYAKLEQLAIKDELTGIYNRRYLNQICDRCIFEALRDKTPLSVALFDIDKFKNINDSYGHLFGDDALKLVASMSSELAENVGGIVGRYGGEEFVVLFPNRSLESTYEVVKEFHEEIRAASLYCGMESVQIRLSVGISSFPETCQNPTDLLNYADWAMYYSKENGRDRITIDSLSIREQVRFQ